MIKHTALHRNIQLIIFINLFNHNQRLSLTNGIEIETGVLLEIRFLVISCLANQLYVETKLNSQQE